MNIPGPPLFIRRNGPPTPMIVRRSRRTDRGRGHFGAGCPLGEQSAPSNQPAAGGPFTSVPGLKERAREIVQFDAQLAIL